MKRTLAILAACAVLVVAPLVLVRTASDDREAFAGTDARATQAVEDTGYEPWFAPVWQPPGTETESLLFALQAAIGAGILGYVLGVFRTRHRLGASGGGAVRGGAERQTSAPVHRGAGGPADHATGPGTGAVSGRPLDPVAEAVSGDAAGRPGDPAGPSERPEPA